MRVLLCGGVPEPVGAYTETGLLETRVFELGEHELRFFARHRFGDIHEQKLRLADLRPEPSRSWVRSRTFESAVAWLCLILLLGLIAFASISDPARLDPQRLAHAIWLIIALVLLTIAAYVAIPRRVEVAVFHNAAGLPVLAIARRGAQRDRFGAFVAELSSRITRAAGGAHSQ